MRIFIVTTFPIREPYDDAPKNLAIDLVKNLNDHKFILIGSGKNFLKGSNVKWINYPFSGKKVHYMPLLQRTFVFLNIIIYMSKTDIFHFILTPEQYSSFMFRIIFRLFRKKSVQTIPSIHTLEAKRKCKKIDKLFFADKIVCLSNYSKNKLKGIKNIKKMHPGVSLSKFDPKKIKRVKELKYGSKYVIVYPGNYKLLSSCYGLDNFCKIIKGVVNKLNSVRFIMACRIRSDEDKKLESKFKELATSYNISNNIKFMNLIEDMPSLFKTCDIGIYPAKKRMISVLEIPLVLLELMAMKKPIIIGDVCPLDEIMKSKVGIILSSYSPEDYIKAIIKLLKNPKLREDMGNNGRRVVMKYFNLNDSIKDYRNIYKSVGEE